MTAAEADALPLPAPVAAEIRAGVTRAGVGFLLAGLLLAGITVTLVLAAPGGAGALRSVTLGGGVSGGALVVLAGACLLDARQLMPGQTFHVRRARRLHRLLLLLFLLSVVITGLCGYGLARVADAGDPIAAYLLPPLAGCGLTALAVVVARLLLRPTAVRR